MVIVTKNLYRIPINFKTNFMPLYNFLEKESIKNNNHIMIDINTFFHVEYDIIEWVFRVLSQKIVKLENEDKFEFSVFVVPFKDWAEKKKTIRIESVDCFKIETINNTLSIQYNSKYAFLVYKYINENIDAAILFREEYKIMIGEKEVKWHIRMNLLNICDLILKNSNCTIEISNNFSYIVDISLNDKSVLEISNE